MSENKDLKTIDDALNSGALNENDVFEFDSATVEIIYGAAERMAAEIERLKAQNALTRTELSNFGAILHDYSDSELKLKSEIDRLKAELEKLQPIATSCNGNDENICQITHLIKRAIIEGRENEECNLYWIQCWDLLREIKHLKAELEKRPKIVECGECYKNGNKDECPFAWVKANNHTGIILYDSTSFCSYGEHRESEEK